MSYLNVYYSRVNHLGETTAERIRNGGMRSFEKWKAESPHTVRNLSVERGLYFDGIILTNKDKEYEKILFLHVSNNIPIRVGDIMNWQMEDGTIEKWLLIQEQKKVNEKYRTFWIVRCNYLLKWIDNDGHLQQSWAYVVSSVDSKIKGNFRTWNNLITPQPNKYAELVMPNYPISRTTNFIIEDESWAVVEYDHTSVPGVIYLSTTEGKINNIYDDVVNNIADMDKLAKYDLITPVEKQVFNVGQIFIPFFTLTKNGVPVEEELTFLSNDKIHIKIKNNQIEAIAPANDVEIIVQLTNHPTISKTITIEIARLAEPEFYGYIEGVSSIRLNRQATYSFIGNMELTGEVSFSIIEGQEFADIVSQENNTCIVKANIDNKLGSCTLCAHYNGIDYTKNISIVTLW